MKSTDIKKARTLVKEMTRHNDKLGFDYSVPLRQYVRSFSD